MNKNNPYSVIKIKQRKKEPWKNNTSDMYRFEEQEDEKNTK